MRALIRDLRYGFRVLAKSPGFTLIAFLTLGLGIGANTAVFTAVNALLLRPLSYEQPQELYVIREVLPRIAKVYPTIPANLPDFRIWQERCHSFESIAIAKRTDVDLDLAGIAREIHGVTASANLFHVLGVRPMLGRTFRADEDAPGHDHVVILAYSFWRDSFHSDSAIVGKTVALDGAPYTIVGVLSSSFHFPKQDQLGALVSFGSDTDFFKPLGVNSSGRE